MRYVADPLSLKRVRDRLVYIREAMARQEADLAKLTVVAPRDGVVFFDSQAEQRIGRYLERGTPLCTVADPQRLEAMLVTDQDDVLEVQPGASVRIQIYSEPGRHLQGTVRTVSQGRLESLPRSLTQAAAGDVPARVDPRTGQAQPVQPSYVVLVDLQGQRGGLWPGLRGYAKIDCGSRTLAARAWRWLLRTFSFKLGL